MSKGLEALEKLKDELEDYTFYEELTSKPAILYGRTHEKSQAFIDTICANYKVVRIINLEEDKKLKALEIIKEYFVLTSEYGKISFELKKEIPEDKYDLLKEVLP